MELCMAWYNSGNNSRSYKTHDQKIFANFITYHNRFSISSIHFWATNLTQCSQYFGMCLIDGSVKLGMKLCMTWFNSGYNSQGYKTYDEWTIVLKFIAYHICFSISSGYRIYFIILEEILFNDSTAYKTYYAVCLSGCIENSWTAFHIKFGESVC